MDAPENSAEKLPPVTWPVAGSLILTSITVAMVCVPPFSGLRSIAQLVALASVYMLVAGCVHALAMWSIYRIQSAGVREWAHVWSVVWGAWIAVVWLPLVALLTYERSAWVAGVMPLAAVFLTMFMVSRRRESDDPLFAAEGRVRAPMFGVDESPRLWRMLLPSLLVAVLLDGGAALYATSHAWIAGALFAVAVSYLAERLLSRTAERLKVRDGAVRRASAGNSLTVWVLTVVALLPFLAGMGLAIRGVLAMPAVQAAHAAARLAHTSAKDWAGIILMRPKMRHEIVVPLLSVNSDSSNKSRMIPFDGQYWYFQPPDAQPGAQAHVVEGDPMKSRIRSTNWLAVRMEAHQRLAKEMEANCCHALQLNLVNADAVPGTIWVEVVLRDSSSKPASSVLLGSKVLVSSTVSPMPLKRAPVYETLTFQIPRVAKDKGFDEITVKVKPEMGRALAAPEVAVESFAFQR